MSFFSCSLYEPRAHHAGAYPGFRSMKRLGVLLLPLDGMLVHRRVTPSSKFAGTHLYTWVKRGTMRVKYLAQEHNAVPRPGLEPGPPDPESSALTIRPPRLPSNLKLDFSSLTYYYSYFFFQFDFSSSGHSIVTAFLIKKCPDTPAWKLLQLAVHR